MTKRTLKIASTVIGLGLLLTYGGLSPMWGQSFTASLHGSLTDSSGAVVPGVKVTLVNEATNVRSTARSDDHGRYSLNFLPPGMYRLTAEMGGFKTFVQPGVELQVQQAATLDVSLVPGDVTTTVEVNAEAPRLDAASATLGRVIDNRSVMDMPLNSRNALDLVSLAAGVVTGIPGGGGQGTNFVSNGNRQSNSDVLIDGVTATNPEPNGGITQAEYRPSVESVQEFKVQTNSFSAEFGNTGGTVINMVSRSGTNQFHGSLLEFLRNSALNANNFFANRAGNRLVPFRRNQFGGSVGGPLWIPRVFDGHNRTFFFYNVEMTRQSSQTVTSGTLPTQLERDGNFSQTLDAKGSLIPIFNPYTGHRDPSGAWVRDPYPGNVIPANLQNPVASAVVHMYPNPTGSGNQFTHVNNYFVSSAAITNGYEQNIKLDHNFTDRDRLSGRYGINTSTLLNPNTWGNYLNPGGSASQWTRGQNASLEFTHTLNPSTILNVRYGLTRRAQLNAPYGTSFDPKQLGFTGQLDIQIPPRFDVQQYMSIGTDKASQVRAGRLVNNFVASLTKIKGMHTIKFGGDMRLYLLNHAQPGVKWAQFYFGQPTTMQNPMVSVGNQGNGIATMLTGFGTSGSQTVNVPGSFASRSYSWYFNDDLQVTPNLTVSLGVRYELDLPRTERFNRLAWIDLAAKSPLNVPQLADLRGGLVFAGDSQRSSFDTDTNNFAPRVAFAYKFARKTVVRGGYGIYYGISPGGASKWVTTGYMTSTNWLASIDSGVTLNASLSNPYPNGTAAPPGNKLGLMTNVGFGLPSDQSAVDVRSWGTKPYYQQWSMSIQRELPLNSLLEVVWTGSRGVHLEFGGAKGLNKIDAANWSMGSKLNDQVANPFYGVITDPLSALSRPTVTRMQLLKPYPQFTGLSGFTGPPIANSIYHAGQIKYTKRFSYGLSLSAHYTFSKTISDSDDFGNVGMGTSAQCFSNLRLERAVSPLDITHRTVVDFAYTLPIGRGKRLGTQWNRWIDTMFGGWQANGIMVFQSGLPLIPSMNNGNLPDSTQMPNLLRDPGLPGSVESRLNKYLDSTAFSRPAPYTLGNAPRTLSTVRAPGVKNSDVSLFKNVYFGGDRRKYLQIRGEAFNVVNRPQFGSPNVAVGNTNFGVISNQSNSPRQLQLAMKIYF